MTPEEIRERILYEDDQILVFHKPAGIAVESARVTQPDLIGMLKFHLAGGSICIVHRLDQVVDGILVFAKTKMAAAELSRQLSDGTMRKLYRARVCGRIPEESGTLTDYLIKDARTNTARILETPGEGGKAKKAILHYRKTGDDELEIELITGRFHQIRAQLSHAGMPIAGDTKYGAPEGSREGLSRGQIALTAAELSFRHPGNHREMNFRVMPSSGIVS